MSQAVLITGAQSGTGYGIAEFFAKQGWDVFITSRKSAEAEASAKKLAETYASSPKVTSATSETNSRLSIFSRISTRPAALLKRWC